MSRKGKHSLLLLLGPMLFLAATLLLLVKVGYLLAHPVWICSFILSLALTCWITWMIFEEWRGRERTSLNEQATKEEEIARLQALIEETHVLYRQKVDLLEKELQESAEVVSEDLKELGAKYDSVLEEALNDKTHATALKASLEDALEELHEFRQLKYLWEENEKTYPSDLPHKYAQLRSQFEGQSERVHKMKRDLFSAEGKLTLLQKEREEEVAQDEVISKQTVQMIEGLVADNERLITEISALEGVITSQFQKAPRKKKADPVETVLELKF